MRLAPGSVQNQATSAPPAAGAGVDSSALSPSTRLRASRSCHGEVNTTTGSQPPASSSNLVRPANGSKQREALPVYRSPRRSKATRGLVRFPWPIAARRWRSASLLEPALSGCGASQCQTALSRIEEPYARCGRPGSGTRPTENGHSQIKTSATTTGAVRRRTPRCDTCSALIRRISVVTPTSLQRVKQVATAAPSCLARISRMWLSTN